MSYAQNMYIDWILKYSSYDLVVKSWYCSTNSRSTYWAVHQWSNGYAGFQNVSSTDSIEDNRIILAIWDDGTNLAAIEYYTAEADTSNFDFSGEGTGKHIISDIDWQDDKWYCMAVGVKSDSEYTYYFYWTAEELIFDWKLYGIIRLPVGGRTLNKSSVFQEDFGSTPENLRRCRISHAYGRAASTQSWESWNSGKVQSYNPNTQIWNSTYECDFSMGTYPDGEYVTLTTGNNGGTCSVNLPHIFEFSIAGTSPISYPKFPCYIKSNFSNLYVSPDSDEAKVVQKAVRHWWNFVDAGNGYVYILTTDRKKAITISGTSSGNELILSAFSDGNDMQKWKIENVSDVCYLYPKNAPSLNMDIRGPSYEENASIQIWTHDTTSLQFKWTVC